MESERPDRETRPPSMIPWVLLVVVLAAGVTGGIWWWRTRPAPAPAPVAASPAPPAPRADEASKGPDLDEGAQRAALEGISTAPAWRALLADGDWIRRLALIVENVAEGNVPRKPLAAIAPTGAFRAASHGGRLHVAPESFRRYDAVGDLVAGVDPATVASAYRALRPMLERAYRALGYPDGSIDRVTARALARIERVPFVEGEVALVEGKGAIYAYADPRLESLPDVEKQVIRMGPRNARILREKARALSAALALPPP